ncbi:Membrane-bound lytic murein transglycosylase C [Geobacteraceae bacterium]|nr:Membrane-bound lytic murein transglycosylase C [Geobacteraceae bacterium]
MLIDTLINRPATPESKPQADRAALREAVSGLVFDELLAAGAAPRAGTRASLAAAAELMRLDMMRSAFSLGDAEGGESPPVMGRAVELMLKSFAENGREPAAAPTPPDASETPAPAPAGAAAVSHPIEEKKSGNWLDDVVSRASRRYGVEVGLIKAVIKAESNFNPNAVSRVGAQGLMQLMPATARGLGVTDSFDPEQNVMAGTKFLKDLLARYNGNVDKALAAYNWGPGNVDRKPHLLPRETREYLVKVKEFYNQFA